MKSFRFLEQETGISSGMIGIATPYRAQIRRYRKALGEANKSKPALRLQDIRIGTTEFWQGQELTFIMVDLVRATNDAGKLDLSLNLVA